ncbi:hypothetical protein KQX54_014560 [Cotesia glomerata]|uniref:Uncharacterized protein n=1 Tax=Cotesia glomerata TaxID=32391 RepID=A0AAV7IN46_COTGL|nr:hypothetical protein KQX54_014560 [Cotesia glomerata]
MCKISLIIIIILTTSATFVENFQDGAVIKQSRLHFSDPEVQKLIDDGWSKLVSEGRGRNAIERGSVGLIKAQVQVKGKNKKYTILVRYYAKGVDSGFLWCYILAHINKNTSMFIDCYEGFWQHLTNPNHHQQYSLFYYLFENM